jgi:hypothetical protein
LWLSIGFLLTSAAWVFFWTWALSGAIWFFVLWGLGGIAFTEIPRITVRLCADIADAPGSFMVAGCAPMILPAIVFFLLAFASTFRAYKGDPDRLVASVVALVTLAIVAQLALTIIDRLL